MAERPNSSIANSSMAERPNSDYTPVFWADGVATLAFLSERGVREFSAGLFLPASG